MLDKRYKVSALSVSSGEKVEGWLCIDENGRTYIAYGNYFYIETGSHGDKTLSTDIFYEVDPATIEPIKVQPVKSFGWICPNCNHEFVAPAFAYCHDCGQALDWGDSAKPSGESKSTTETE